MLKGIEWHLVVGHYIWLAMLNGYAYDSYHFLAANRYAFLKWSDGLIKGATPFAAWLSQKPLVGYMIYVN